MSDLKGGKTPDYEVGYGKPPKHTQWKPGQSGNPAGAKKKDETFIEKVKKIAEEEIIVNKGGQPHAMSNLDAAIYAVMSKAHTGHAQAFKIVADLLGKEAVAAVGAPEFKITEADLTVLKTAADWQALLEAARNEAGLDPTGEDYDGGQDDDDADTHN